MLYRVMCGRLAAGTAGGPGKLPAATDGELEAEFDCICPARLLLELVELSSVLLIEIAVDWYVGAPERDGRCWAIWLEAPAPPGG